MAANIDSNLANWSTTAASNQPDTTDSNDIVSDLRQIQVVVRKYLATKGSDIASGATVDLSTATGNYVHVTGVTTVTALGTVAAGLRYLLVFDGALTFTHNATSLILPGGANITTAAGDRCEVVSLGSGNWRCLWFQPAAGTPLVTVPVANGGTGATSASAARTNLSAASSGANSDITSLSGLTTALSIAQGGTASTTAAAARTALGLAIGTDVQAYDADIAIVSASQAEMEAGTEAALRSMSPLRVAQAISALGSSLKISNTATASGTAVDFTGIPSTAKRVTVMLNGVSTNGTANLLIQIGDSGGIETTGYVSTSVGTAAGGNGATSSTAGFVIFSNDATNSWSGNLTINLLDSSTFEYIASGTFTPSTSVVTNSAGNKQLTTILDRLRVTTSNGTDAFDAGKLSYSYE